MNTLYKVFIFLCMFSSQLFGQQVDQSALARMQEARSFGWGIAAINSWAHGVMKDDAGMVWLTSADGLVRFDGKRFVIMADPNRKYTFFRRVFEINNKLFLGDMDKPLHFYDTSDSIPKIEKVQWEQNMNGELNIWSTYKHHDDKIFLADYKGIIYQYNGDNQLDTFFIMPPDVVEGKILKHTARYIRADPFDTDMIWVCSIHGLFHINMKDKSYEFYYPKDQFGLHIRLEEEGYTFYDHIQMGENIWISSFENGLVRFNTEEKNFKSFRYEFPKDETSIGTNNIRSHQQYDDQNILVGGRDLKIFNTIDNKFYDFTRGHDDFDPPVLLAVEIYKDGDDFYTISAGALSKISPDYNLFKSGNLNRLNISDEIKSVTSVRRISNSELEIVSNTGQKFSWNSDNLELQRGSKIDPVEPGSIDNDYNIERPKYNLVENKIYNESQDEGNVQLVIDGLSEMQAIHLDENNHLWIKAKEGLVRYNPDSQDYRIYGQTDGLWNYVWSEPGIIREFDDGALFVSTGQTFTYFHPDELLEEDYELYPYVYKLEVFNETRMLSRVLDKAHDITLAPEDNYFSIHYSTHLENHGQSIVYECKLDGFDEHWINVGKSNVATYSKVPPGDYKFMLRASYPGSKWSEITENFKITIEPTFTQTIYFKLLLLIALAGIVTLFYRLRTSYLLKEQKIKSKYEQELSEAKLEALRSQMNPHFLFNSLNSIDNFILNNDAKTASDYLTKFSKLIRRILDNSGMSKLNLAEELRTLDLYIKLEQMRFPDKFDYNINIAGDLDIQSVNVPPMILQPFVENAIWHGLMHLDYHGQLDINLFKSNKTIVCEIDDNGIGRDKAGELKSKNATKHKSHGIKITQKRLRLNQELFKIGGSITFEDKKNEHGGSKGTKVIVKFPSNEN